MKQFKYIYLLFTIILINQGCIQKGNSDKKAIQESGYQNSFVLVWEDDFNYTGLPDSTKWFYDTEGNDAGWGNNESQFYTFANKENAFVENGSLRITAIKEKKEGKDFTSARLVSKSYWKYGRFDIKAKLPSGIGTWPAIWMMPGDWSFNDGNWPDIGEIDIMEHVGHEPGVVHSSAHSKDYQWQNGTQKTARIKIPEANNKFHVYSLEWTPDVLKAFVNDSLYFEYQNEGLGDSKWPYNKPFYLILNVAVGGQWGAAQGIDTSAFPQSMLIDYVKVYQKQ